MILESVDRPLNGLVIASEASRAGRRRPRPAHPRLGCIVGTEGSKEHNIELRLRDATWTAGCNLEGEVCQDGSRQGSGRETAPGTETIFGAQTSRPPQRNIALGVSRMSPLDASGRVEVELATLSDGPISTVPTVPERGGGKESEVPSVRTALASCRDEEHTGRTEILLHVWTSA